MTTMKRDCFQRLQLLLPPLIIMACIAAITNPPYQSLPRVIAVAEATAVNSRHMHCRCVSQNCWPKHSAWSKFFSVSDGGSPFTPPPPALPCYIHLSGSSCSITKAQWNNPFWREQQPGAMQLTNLEAYHNLSCHLVTSETDLLHSSCNEGALPLYSINATNAKRIQSAVRFAAYYNLRLTMKATGHDYAGRSTARGSFNVWMHNMKKITFHPSFTPQGCNDDQATTAVVTAEPGVTWEELYSAVAAENRVVVGSLCPSVSASGGYMQGGGHSPLGPLLGMAADNVVEIKIVTADGKLRTANACQEKDLFWAVRGGGGGTFGVVVSATHKTHPTPNSILSVMYRIDALTADNFQGLLLQLIKLEVALAESGAWVTYSSMEPTWTLKLVNMLPIMQQYPVYNTSAVDFLFQPMNDYCKAQNLTVKVLIKVYSSFDEWRHSLHCSRNPDFCSPTATGDITGFNSALASRIFPKSVLQERPNDVASTLMAIMSPQPGKQQLVNGILGVLAGGRAVAATTEKTNAVNPAWRQGLWHIILASGWADNATSEEVQSRMHALTSMNSLLRELTPNSGSYLNEADVNEPHWQQSFFGHNYNRLRDIKRHVDPHDLFVCKECVGSEDWDEEQTCRRHRV